MNLRIGHIRTFYILYNRHYPLPIFTQFPASTLERILAIIQGQGDPVFVIKMRAADLGRFSFS